MKCSMCPEKNVNSVAALQLRGRVGGDMPSGLQIRGIRGTKKWDLSLTRQGTDIQPTTCMSVGGDSSLATPEKGAAWLAFSFSLEDPGQRTQLGPMDLDF